MYCIYCNGNNSLINRNNQMSLKGDFYSGIELYIDSDGLHVEAVSDTYEPNYMEEHVRINFCPMCGKKINPSYSQEKI